MAVESNIIGDFKMLVFMATKIAPLNRSRGSGAPLFAELKQRKTNTLGFITMGSGKII
jgi:hypothetical protein